MSSPMRGDVTENTKQLRNQTKCEMLTGEQVDDAQAFALSTTHLVVSNKF